MNLCRARRARKGRIGATGTGGQEVDYVIEARRNRQPAVECKWSANNFDPTNLIAFRYQHPEGDNLVLAHDVERAFTRSYGDLRVRFDGIRSFADSLSS